MSRIREQKCGFRRPSLSVIFGISFSGDAAKRKAQDANPNTARCSDTEWEKAVIELSDGGVDHVVEVGGPGTLARSLRAIRIGGNISLIRVLSGAADINPMLIFSRRANVQGISVGSAQMFQAMNRAIGMLEEAP
jgi:NADPH:quinone reductase-like Zn-dependent oxidoreductase